jgi:uncharacterized protein (TIGR00369 family)
VHFTHDGGEVSATFAPADWHQGWQGVVHGGILAALLDEAMAYTLFFEGQSGVTARMELRYRQSVRAGEAITVEARITAQTSRIADISGAIRRNGEIVVEGAGRFMKLGPISTDTASALVPNFNRRTPGLESPHSEQ